MPSKDEQRPKVGVGVMIFKGGEVLLGKRGEGASHGAGEYCFPGGHLEYMESPTDCAVRETREECEVEIDNIRFLLAANVRKYGRHHILLGFIADWKSGEPKTLEPEKIASWQWYALDKLPNPIFEASALMLRSYQNKNYYADPLPS